MISIETFLLGLVAISIATGLVTEGIKKIYTEHKKNYYANTLAGMVSVILSIITGACYGVLADIPVNNQFIVCVFGLAFLSWIGAMVGYDKAIQAVAQFKTAKERIENNGSNN